MKTCVRCRQEKSLDSFYRNNRSSDGRAYACKECKKLARSKDVSRRNYEKRKTTVSAYYKERYASGGDESREASRLAAKAASGELSDAYIRRLITQRSSLLPKNIPSSLVAVKRLQVQILRLAKEINDEKC